MSTAPRPLSHRVHMVSFLFACLLWRHVYRNRALWYKELEDSGQKTCIKPHEPHPSPSVFRGTEDDADSPSAIRFHSAFLLFFVLFSASSASDTHQHLTPIDRALSAPALYPVQEECMKKLLCLLLTLSLLTPCAAGLGERHFEGSPWINPELIW